MPCHCKKQNCQTCNTYSGCHTELQSSDIVSAVELLLGVDENGCYKYVVPPTIPTIPSYFGCDGVIIAPNTQIARCTEVDAKVASAIDALRIPNCAGVPQPLNTPFATCADANTLIANAISALRIPDCNGVAQPLNTQFATCTNVNTLIANAVNALRLTDCNGNSVTLSTPVVTCANYAQEFCDTLSGLPASPYVAGVTQLLSADCGLVQIPAPTITTDVSIVGGILTVTVNGVSDSSPIPADVQVTNASLAGTTLTITESNGDLNSLDLVSILNAIRTCDNTPFDHNIDRLIKCSQLNGLITNNLELVGAILTSTVNGNSAQVDLSGLLPTPCAFGATIPSGVIAQIVGVDAGNCLVRGTIAIPSEYPVAVNAPITGNGLAANPLDINFGALSATDLCALGGAITNVAQPTTLLGKDSAGCITQLPLDCACDTARPYSTFGYGCVGGGIGEVQFRERFNSVVL